MVKPLSYPRCRCFYESGFHLDVFIERTIYFVPSCRYPYHIFVLKDGERYQKHYRKILSAALKVVKVKAAV